MAADRFVDSVGVCTHLDSPPYADRKDLVRRMAAALGVRHLRDEVRPTNDLAGWRRLAQEAGLRFHLLASTATNSIEELTAFAARLGHEAISAVEGQNEGDGAWFMAQEAAKPVWYEAVNRYQRALYGAVHASLPGVPVLSPTVLDYRPQDVARLLPSAPFCDMVALHAYLQGQQEPETGEDFANIGWYLRTMRDALKPGAPAMVTETGYATAVGGVSAGAAAIYLPRLLLHMFDRGVVRTFLYELMDEGRDPRDPEQQYGLLTVAGAPKPAFRSLARLLRALSDPGPGFVPAPVVVTVEQGPPDLRLMAFGRRDGTIVLALWRMVRVWDKAARRDLPVAATTVRLAVPGSRATLMRLEEDAPALKLLLRRGRVELALNGSVALLYLE